MEIVKTPSNLRSADALTTSDETRTMTRVLPNRTVATPYSSPKDRSMGLNSSKALPSRRTFSRSSWSKNALALLEGSASRGMVVDQCVGVGVFYRCVQVGSKAATALACLLASIAFSALPKVLELLRGSFSRALTLTFPRPTSLLRIYANSHLAQTPDNPLDCHIILRQITALLAPEQPTLHATLTQ